MERNNQFPAKLGLSYCTGFPENVLLTKNFQLRKKEIYRYIVQVFFCFYNSWHWKFLSDVENGLFYYFILWNEIGYVLLQTLATKLLLSASVTPAVKEKSGSEKSARTHEKKTFIKSQYTYS